MNRKIIYFLLITLSFMLNPLAIVQGMAFETQGTLDTDIFDSFDWQNGINDLEDNFVASGSEYDENFDVGSFLSDNDNTYGQVWDPWITKAAIHAVATTEDGDMMALAGGYLYDDEIHLYRWNYDTDNYDLVAEVGSGVFKSDVLCLAFADVDYNNLIEIIAGSEDGYIYVFEQRHLYDPYTNSENEFDLVWKSKRLGRIFSLTVDDTDLDFRQDIIVGTGNMLRFYEYDTHGSYPFGPDHWMELREVFSYEMPSQITALDIADVDYDSLKEVAVGMYSGEIILMENNGTHLDINGYPYPIVQDNSYKPIWSSGTTIRRPVSDMSGGDIDDDNHKELMIAVQGQGAYVLDNINGNIGTYRVERPYTSWENVMLYNPDASEIYPLDYFTDRMINSSSLINGVLQLPPEGATNPGQANVYHQNATGYYAEPLNYTNVKYLHTYPYASHSDMLKDGYYTTFDASTRPAWAVYDWGYDEEAASNGVANVKDLIIYTSSQQVTTDNLHITISQNGWDWYKVNTTYITKYTGRYELDVDDALKVAKMDWYRYINVTVLSGKMAVDVLYTKHVNKPIYDALSSEVGTLMLPGENVISNVGYIGTIDGSVLGIDWNPTKQLYEVIWDSWEAERWKLNKNIFDLALIKQTSRFPAWIKTENDSFNFDLSGKLPDGGEAISYTVDNFYNYNNERSLEFIVSSSKGKLMVYTQTSPDAEPIYNPILTTLLFELPFPNLVPSVNNYIEQQMVRFPDAKYFTASVVPMNAKLSKTDTFSVADNGYWLFVGQWSGIMGDEAYNIPVGTNDVSVFYLAEGDENFITSAPHAAFFLPIMDFEAFKVLTLGNTEATGQLKGVLQQSTWMPKISAVDLIGSSSEDLILTNGKIHLLETTVSLNPTYGAVSPQEGEMPEDVDALDKIFGRLDTSYVGDYFKEINENSKGRIWSSSNPVDFDGDGDTDLILGFARYNETLFGIGKSSYGMTYWENQGSNENPIWVENKKAVTNNDATSNFRVANFTDPVFIYDEYEFGDDGFDYINGYHPSYKTDRPSTLLMTQIDPAGDSIFKGTVYRFKADYTPPTAFLAATYPEVKRIDINLENREKNPGNMIVNYGFHIFETWDNEEELSDWTLSLDTADMDEDGKNEIIVGDFNNNVFVFEHLSNNSYKRAFKTFDINRTIEAEESPYAHEQFGGIDGTFYRTLFDHVEYVMAGVDLNQNGYQEFLAASANMIFIFEGVPVVTGKVREDTYQLVAMIDLLDTPALIDMATEDIHISALSWADDLTGEGRRELLVGVGPALLMYEVSDDNRVSLYATEEVYYGQAYGKYGLYDAPGNYYLYPDHKINALLVEDLNLDGRPDLVIAGRNEESAKALWSGFISVLEWDGGTFLKLVNDNVFAKTTKFNPIYDLATMDNDLDGHKELVIGHNQGVDLYEFDGEDVSLQEVISSNPHYQIDARNYYKPSIYGQIAQWKDVARSPTGVLKMVYIVNAIDWDGSIYQSDLRIATSNDNGKNWINDQVIFTVVPYQDTYPFFEDLGLVYDGSTLWLTFVLRSGTKSGIGTLDAFIMRNPGTETTYKQIDFVTGSDLNMHMSPRAFSFPGSNSNLIGVAYIDYATKNMVKIRKYNWATGGAGDLIYTPTWANGSIGPKHGNKFHVQSLDMVELETDVDNDFALVFSGHRYNEAMSLDDDLFYVGLHLNSTTNWLFNSTQAQRTYASGLHTSNPSIIQESKSNNIMVTFEETTLRPYGGLFAVWTNDLGNTWHGPYDMSYQTGIEAAWIVPFVSRSKETFTLGTLFDELLGIGESIIIRNFESHYPVIAPGTDAGFTMVYNIRFDLTEERQNRFGTCARNNDKMMSNVKSNLQGCANVEPIKFEYIVSANNDWSNFTWYDLDHVQKLTVGDTDRDGRQEILVASGKRASLFEFSQNSATFILHNQKWISREYERPITEVAISDANGNGLPEIIIESERGVVNAFEVTDATMGQADILYPVKQKTFTNALDTSGKNRITKIVTEDYTGDGVDDILYSTGLGQIGLINGATMTSVYLTPKLASVREDNILLNPITKFGGTTIIHAYNSTIRLINAATGAVINTNILGDHTEDQFIVDVEVNPDFSEVFVSGAQGWVYKLSGTDLAEIWERDDFSFSLADDYFSGLNYVNGTLFVNSIAAQYALLDAGTGVTIWEGDMPTYNYPPPTAIDINNDGVKDYVIMGYNLSFAIDGSTGLQLWNKTNTLITQYAFYVDPILMDLNRDGIEDIVYVNLIAIPGMYDVFAVDSTNGKIIWSEELSTNTARTRLDADFGDVSFGTEEIGLILSSVTNIGGNSLGQILDVSNGMTVAGIPSSEEIYAMGASNFGGNVPYVVVGGKFGNITTYKLYEGQPVKKTSVDPLDKTEPFIRVGEDFTSRTKFLLASAFADGKVGNDGIDDIFVADDFFLGGADTDELETNPSYNEAMWQIFNKDWGRFDGFAEIVSYKEDQFIIASFQKALVMVEITTGDLIWEHTYPDDDFKSSGMPNVVIDDLNMDDKPEIIMGMRQYKSGAIYGRIEIVDIDDGKLIKAIQHKGFSNAKVVTADLDADDKREILVVMRNATNPYWTRFAVYDADYQAYLAYIPSFGGDKYIDIKKMPVVSDIAVGDFDKALKGDEFMFFFELSSIDVPDVLYNFMSFPTMYMMLGLDVSSGFEYPSGLLTFAPYHGRTRDHWVFDIDGDGNDDLIGLSRYGDLFSFFGVDSGTSWQLSMDSGGTYDTLAVPYSRTMLELGDFCGKDSPSYIFVSSATSVSCYPLNPRGFHEEPQAERHWNVKIDIIHDIVVGDLDGDEIQDFIIASRTGYVWIARSSDVSKFMNLDADKQINDIAISLEDIQNYRIVGLVGLLVSPFIIMAIRAKYPSKQIIEIH
ncbi:MAG: PQQ-binding-like beta-propeller repeat protein [Candidatus Heimdallarchaeota archaeon]|nr:PQQ-binding-like beta-propeller repeat protein [Candidatus Heimdallarchaeota archaeon]